MELEYTPQQPKQAEPPKPAYELVTDVTGKPPLKRGPQVMKAYCQVLMEETGSNGEVQKKKTTMAVNFKVPYPPKENCKKCHGRGYIGTFTVGEQHGIYFCPKCYPQLQQR